MRVQWSCIIWNYHTVYFPIEVEKYNYTEEDFWQTRSSLKEKKLNGNLSSVAFCSSKDKF